MQDHLSHSSINTYLLCPRSWRMRYVDKVQTPSASALVFGGAFHDTVETALSAVAQGETSPLATSWLLKLWSEKWQAKIAKEQVAWGDESPEELAALGARMLGNKLEVSGAGPNRIETMPQFLSKIVPMMDDDKPAIERKIELRVPGVPVPVIGYIDIVCADGVPGDFKTASRAWYADKAHEEMQPVFYLAALAQMGMPVPDGKFRYYIFTKAQKPKAQIIETKRTPSQLLWLFEVISETWQAIQASSFPPNPCTWKCSPAYCEYWQMCRGK